MGGFQGVCMGRNRKGFSEGSGKTTGRFKTRKNLERFILDKWDHTRLTVKAIALEAQVTPMTAHRILEKNGREKPVRKPREDKGVTR